MNYNGWRRCGAEIAACRGAPGSTRKVLAGGGDGEFAVFNALGGDQFVGDLLDGFGLAAHDEDFQAIMVVEMDVEGRDDYLMVVMLDVGESRLDVLLVMVVKERNGAGNFAGTVLLLVLDEGVAHLIGDSLRAILVSLLVHHAVKLAQKRRRHRHGEPLNQFLLHGVTVPR